MSEIAGLRQVVPFGDPVTIEIVYDEAADSYSLVVGGVEVDTWYYRGGISRDEFEAGVRARFRVAVTTACRMASLAAWSMSPDLRLTREAGALGGLAS